MILTEKWQKDLAVYQNVNTTFIVEGNINDMQPWIYEEDRSCETVSLTHYLYRYLSEVGYDLIVFYNRIDGFYNLYNEKMINVFFQQAGTEKESLKQLCTATDVIRDMMKNKNQPTAIIFDLANTITTSPDNLSEPEIEYFTKLLLSSKYPTKPRSTCCVKKQLTNLLFLIVEKVNDIPAWFYLNNPFVKPLTITHPGNNIRRIVIEDRIDELPETENLSTDDKKVIIDQFTALTDGMTLVELFGIFSLCRDKNFSVFQLKEALRLFRYGEMESHWDRLDPEKIKNIEEFLSKRVKGQPEAIRKTAMILKRAYLGLSGIQGGLSSRPKGVLFFAGPTGTGKTELAKTIAEFVFGDEQFVTRFDMSEYREPHSDQKLLGAPPGYVGYSEGGQLTNAVKNKPFSVLLFDEIEKAHPTILDKFLQILDDGRLTDSSGRTVYFSESLIIFTSNLGIVGKNRITGEKILAIDPDKNDYNSIKTILLASIRDYFIEIQRPEILNRIGENFIVFDFIRDDVAKLILEMKLKSVIENLEHEKGIFLEIAEPFREYLLSKVHENRDNGGRGISNIVETSLINPLSDVLIEENWHMGTKIIIEHVDNKRNSFSYTII